jgi:hypothetical protein
MSKGKYRFKKTDLTRAVKGVQELDLPVKCVRITADGQIEVEVGVVPLAPDDERPLEL